MGITMLVGKRYTILKRKILIILYFKNYFFPTYLQLCEHTSDNFKNFLRNADRIQFWSAKVIQNMYLNNMPYTQNIIIDKQAMTRRDFMEYTRLAVFIKNQQKKVASNNFGSSKLQGGDMKFSSLHIYF